MSTLSLQSRVTFLSHLVSDYRTLARTLYFKGPELSHPLPSFSKQTLGSEKKLNLLFTHSVKEFLSCFPFLQGIVSPSQAGLSRSLYEYTSTVTQPVNFFTLETTLSLAFQLLLLFVELNKGFVLGLPWFSG